MYHASLCLFSFLCFSTLSHTFSIEDELSPVEATTVPLKADIDTLQYVQVVWRHGDRTPSTVFPESESSMWKEGLGELTKEGIAQQYRLGSWFRDRYSPWLGSTFDRHEIYVRSSDYNRTLMSAMANMAGLFPPSDGEVWRDDLRWQPVPVHSVPKTIDKQLYEDIECPAAKRELERVWESERLREIERNNSRLLDYIARNMNMTEMRLSKMWTVFDMLNCQSFHNSSNPWPSWVNSSVFHDITVLYDVTSRFEFHTRLLRRLRGGPLLSEMLDRFESKSFGLLGSRPKMYAYSAHDTTLAALLASLGLFPSVFPLYATTVILEMHLRDGQYHIELYHKNMTDSPDLFRYRIPGCPEPCSIEKMRQSKEGIIPSDWDSECGLRPRDMHTFYIGTILVLSLTTLLFGGIVVTDIVLRKRKRVGGERMRESEGRTLLMEEEQEQV